MPASPSSSRGNVTEARERGGSIVCWARPGTKPGRREARRPRCSSARPRARLTRPLVAPSHAQPLISSVSLFKRALGVPVRRDGAVRLRCSAPERGQSGSCWCSLWRARSLARNGQNSCNAALLITKLLRYLSGCLGAAESQNHSMAGVRRALCGSPSPTPCPSRVTQSRHHGTASSQGRLNRGSDAPGGT